MYPMSSKHGHSTLRNSVWLWMLNSLILYNSSNRWAMELSLLWVRQKIMPLFRGPNSGGLWMTPIRPLPIWLLNMLRWSVNPPMSPSVAPSLLKTPQVILFTYCNCHPNAKTHVTGRASCSPRTLQKSELHSNLSRLQPTRNSVLYYIVQDFCLFFLHIVTI